MDNCCHDKACELEQLHERQSKILWMVLSINGIMFCVELLVGLLAGSVALQADSLDMLGDTLVYGFSLYAIGRNARWRAGAAFLKGSIMAIFGFGVLLQSGYKLVTGDIPASHLMGVMSVIALVANASCLLLLSRHKADDLKWRRYRRVNDDGRERCGRALRPRNISVPSSRPRHTTGGTAIVLQ